MAVTPPKAGRGRSAAQSYPLARANDKIQNRILSTTIDIEAAGAKVQQAVNGSGTAR